MYSDDIDNMRCDLTSWEYILDRFESEPTPDEAAIIEIYNQMDQLVNRL